jgi:hypothetical protein
MNSMSGSPNLLKGNSAPARGAYVNIPWNQMLRGAQTNKQKEHTVLPRRQWRQAAAIQIGALPPEQT